MKVFQKIQKNGKLSKTYYGRFPSSGGKFKDYDLGVTTRPSAYRVYQQILENQFVLSLTQGEFISNVIDVYFDNLISISRSKRYISQSRSHLIQIFNYNNWKRVTDISGFGFEKFRSNQKLSNSTMNHYYASLYAFCSWLQDKKLINDHPLKSVKKSRVVIDNPYRRALSDAEVQRLLSVAPFQRFVLYVLVLETGLRRSEVFSLKWSDFDFANSVLNIRSSISKNHKFFRFPLSSHTLNYLQRLQYISDSNRVFPFSSDLWKKDYNVACIDLNKDGVRCDFHSLRKTFITRLVRNNVNPRIVQTLARHSNFNLTSKFYTDENQLDFVSSLDKIRVITSQND